MPDLKADQITIGILGCSDIARRKFIPVVTNSRQATLAALASREQSKAVALLPDGSMAVVMTYEEMICSPNIDLIYVSLPNHLHEAWSIAALEHGKHVICEKPLGLNSDSVGRMIAAATQHKRLLFENLMYLQHPQHLAVKQLIATGYIGRILSLQSTFTFPGPPAGDFRLNPAMGGGAFHDLNRYPLSAALFFLEGKHHTFIRGNHKIQNGLNVAFRAQSVTDANEQFTFLLAFGQPYRSYYEIRGERGNIRVERAYTTPPDMANRIAVTRDDRDESFTVPPNDHFLSTIDHVCIMIRNDNWIEQHQQEQKLADLAEMFQTRCARRNHEESD